MPKSTTSVEPGWRPDPSGRYEYRYWDGEWTNRVANSTRGPGPALPTVAAESAAAIAESRRRRAGAMESPANYGRAGIVALAAGGIATGAYLPWLSGTIDGIHVHRTGFDLGSGTGYWIGAAALAVAALLSVQVRRMRWIAMAVAAVLTGLVARDLLHSYDTMQRINLAPGAAISLGAGLWIMVGSAAVALIAGFRLGEDEKIV